MNIQEVGDLAGVRFVTGAGQDELILAGTGGGFLQVDAAPGGGADHASVTPASFARVVLDGGAGRDTLSGANVLAGPGVSIRSFEVRS
jgi:hypothetical protein